MHSEKGEERASELSKGGIVCSKIAIYREVEREREKTQKSITIFNTFRLTSIFAFSDCFLSLALLFLLLFLHTLLFVYIPLFYNVTYTFLPLS